MLSMTMSTGVPSASDIALKAKDNAKRLPTYLEMAQTERTMELDVDDESSFGINLQ